MAEVIHRIKESRPAQLAAGAVIAGLAITSCSSVGERNDTFEIGVVCEDLSDRIDIQSASNNEGSARKVKTIDLTCTGDDTQTPASLELLAGEGTTVNDGTEFTGVVSVETRGPSTRSPFVDLDVDVESNSGQIELNNVWAITGVEVRTRAERPAEG